MRFMRSAVSRALLIMTMLVVVILGGLTFGTSAQAMPEITDNLAGRATWSVGNEFACAIDTNGIMSCWGRNDASAPQAAPPAGTYRYVATGFGSSCAITTSDTVVCWGAAGPLTAGVPAGTFTAIAMSNVNACALSGTGTVTCWGATTNGITSPPAGNYDGIVVGSTSACALSSAGVPTCWGAGTSFLTIPSEPFTALRSSANYNRYCGIHPDGSLECFGEALGGTVPMPTTGTYTSIATTISAACATRTDGQLVCWGATGSNDYAKRPTTGSFIAVSGSVDGMCAITTTNLFKCWGTVNRTSFTAPYILPHFPTGQVGLSFPQTFEYDWTFRTPDYNNFQLLSGQLPPGLAIDQATGNLVGTPTAIGTYSFVIGADTGASPIATGNATVTINAPVVTGIKILPATATVFTGQTQQYTVAAVSAEDFPLQDITSDPLLVVSSDPAVSCSTLACGSSTPGTYTITAQYPNGAGGDFTATASLIVQDAPPDLKITAISPTTASVVTDEPQAFTLTWTPEAGGPVTDVTAQAVFTIDGPGSCTSNECSSPTAGAFSVTATWTDENSVQYQEVATLLVTGAPPVVVRHVVLAPASATVGVGHPQTYTLTATPDGEASVDVSDQATFTVDGAATCSGRSCVSQEPGIFEVTATWVAEDGQEYVRYAALTVTGPTPTPPDTTSPTQSSTPPPSESTPAGGSSSSTATIAATGADSASNAQGAVIVTALGAILLITAYRRRA